MWQLFILILLPASFATLGDNVNSEDDYHLRIINGSYTPITEIPWQVAHVSPQSEGPDKLLCGGSIISMNKIVTAGHCIKQTLPAILEKSYYRAGSSYYSTGGSIHHINSYLVHPKYIAQEGLNFYIQNDIAIVKVKEPFIYSDTLKPVALDHKYPSNFAKAQISGWGITNPYIANSTARYLLSDKITVFKPYKCLAELGISILHLPRSFFCLGEKKGGIGGCLGDSGGPVTINKKLVGISSAVISMLSHEDSNKRYPCGYKRSATIIQSIAPFTRWMQDSIQSLDETVVDP